MGGVKNVHKGLPLPDGTTEGCVVSDDLLYFYYGCDGVDDRGWGCGYRTLQTLCSAVKQQTKSCTSIPSLATIQETLVKIGDKDVAFLDSRDWIGSVEVALVIDTLYDIPCKIVHVEEGNLQRYTPQLLQHFNEKGTPIMMGGDSDSASKCILGVSVQKENTHLLVLDPHYYGPVPDQQTLIQEHMLLWKPLSCFVEKSFYNLCLPQLICVRGSQQ